jgi:nucleoside phosphorylase
VGWICALSTELVAAQEFLDEEHEKPDFVQLNNPTDYTLGKIEDHYVVIVVLPNYGTAAAGIIATHMQQAFPNIRIGLLVGIGGGVPSKTHDIWLGDVVVSEPRNGHGGVFQYDFGKSIQGQAFQRTGFLNQPPSVLRGAINGMKTMYERHGHEIKSRIDFVLKRNPRIRRKYQRPDLGSDRLFRAEVVHDLKGYLEVCATKDSNMIQRLERDPEELNPRIHYGTIASANQVVKDAFLRDRLASELDILCFEMEAAGLMNDFPCLVIRGICNYSDSHKNDEWHGYAAMTAAAFPKDILYWMTPDRVEAEGKLSDILADD